MPGAARPTVASFVADGPLGDAPGALTLGEDAAHHARVRRLAAGDAVTVRDGAGRVGEGVIATLGRARLDVELAHVRFVAPPPPVHVLAPIGDRERMLWLAEKATELGAASWRPVRWRRSASVSPRGEGEAFAAKVRARTAQALAQSEGAWLPTLHADADPAPALAALPGEGARLVLDADGAAGDVGTARAVVLALGPEGGLEADELTLLDAAGFRRVRLPGNVLRFETAGVVGVALARALLDARAVHAAP